MNSFVRFDGVDQNDLDELKQLKVPIPTNEKDRLQTLRETRLLDSEKNEGDYGRYVSLAARLFIVSSSIKLLIGFKLIDSELNFHHI
jgi:hypothetical protein